MSYTTGRNIQRYQRLSPDIQTEWGTFTNPHIMYRPDQYKYRQPAVPMLARGRSDVIHPRPAGQQHLGYVGDYVLGAEDTTKPLLPGGIDLKTILLIAAVGLVLYLLFRDKGGAKENPCVSDFNELLASGWTPPGGIEPSARRRGRQTREGKKSLSRYARSRARDAQGKFI
jgi:hypothetical protein